MPALVVNASVATSDGTGDERSNGIKAERRHAGKASQRPRPTDADVNCEVGRPSERSLVMLCVYAIYQHTSIW